MLREFSRTRRISAQMQKELALVLQREMRDPRAGMVTVSEVKISRDLSYADVYVTFMGIEESEQSYKKAVGVLNQASGYLRTLTGKAMRLRTLPALRFHYDDTLIRAGRLEELFSQVSDERSPDEDDAASAQTPGNVPTNPEE